MSKEVYYDKKTCLVKTVKTGEETGGVSYCGSSVFPTPEQIKEFKGRNGVIVNKSNTSSGN